MNDTSEDVGKFIKDFKVPYPVTIDSTGDLVYKYRVFGHPTTYFINKEGIITGIITGLTTPETLEKELEKAFK